MPITNLAIMCRLVFLEHINVSKLFPLLLILHLGAVLDDCMEVFLSTFDANEAVASQVQRGMDNSHNANPNHVAAARPPSSIAHRCSESFRMRVRALSHQRQPLYIVSAERPHHTRSGHCAELTMFVLYD